MKATRLLFMSLLLVLGANTIIYSQCSNCIDSSNVISYNGNGTFTASSAQAYFWEIENCEGAASIVGSNTSQTITVNCNSLGRVKIKVTRFVNGNCIEACEIFTCNDIPPPPCNYSLGILDEYIDGTQSGANWVYLHAGGNFPTGTTYTWWITRQNGSTQFYPASTQNPRQVSASINNRITQAKVTATFGNCTETITKIFRCAIPNADINGNLFPECRGVIGGGGFFRTTEKVKVFPNPTNSKITFQGKDLQNKKITITDFMGNVIIKESSLTSEINLNKEKSGIYFYIIIDEQGNRQEGKIIKE